MAKGIFAFGTLVGKLGDVIYYRSGGQQHSRPRIRKPKNPQTNKQLFQRARFSAAGMFYSHGRQAFFPYSFEDKKQNESYFNAFMRNNTHLAYPVSKSVVNNVSYPILQNWVVTKGSLPTIEAYRHSPDNGNTIGLAFNFPLYSSQTSINTMADLSRALIATGDFDNGDILTFLTILTDMRLDTTAYGLYPEIVPEQSRSARWFIRQFNVNTSDTTQLSTYNIAATLTEDNEVRVNVWGYNTSWWPNQLAGGTIVHSRVKGSRTQVSTQALVLSEVADEQINTLLVQNYAEYVDAVINNWRTSEQDIVIQPTEILQGSNSINFNFQPEPEPVVFPITTNPLYSNDRTITFQTSKPLPHGNISLCDGLDANEVIVTYNEDETRDETFLLVWNENESAWISYVDEEPLYRLTEEGNNTYTLINNNNRVYLAPYIVKQGDNIEWINPNEITRTVVKKITSLDIYQGKGIVQIEPSQVITNELCFKLYVKNGDTNNTSNQIRVEGESEGLIVNAVFNASEKCVEIRISHTLNSSGDYNIFVNDLYFLQVYCYTD